MSEGTKEGELTASLILNTWDENLLELILRGFGEERFSRRIAKEIVERRQIKPFSTTFDLVDAINTAVGKSYKSKKINPATKSFQALRIAVNEELQSLEEGLIKAFEALKPNGRLAVISFHSLEDRIVKNYFKSLSSANLAKVINKKPIIPSESEILENPRSRSAKLRVVQKI
jgi:16S rRNA (cytosine1402-N4)-methyltransferase